MAETYDFFHTCIYLFTLCFESRVLKKIPII